jgi:hypothetical protein
MLSLNHQRASSERYRGPDQYEALNASEVNSRISGEMALTISVPVIGKKIFR